MNGAIGIKGASTLTLNPGAMLRLNDVDNLRVLATKKGLILRAGDNGRRALKLVWNSPKAAAKAAAKGATQVPTMASSATTAASKASAAAAKAKAAAIQAEASAAQSKALAASANKMALAADTMTKTAKSMATAKAVGGGAAKVAATGAGLGIGLGLGALGPALLVGGVLVASGVYVYRRNRRPESPPEY